MTAESKREILGGGNVHSVERVPGDIIIKTRYTGNPDGLTMYTVAEDIVYEADALKDAYAVMPSHFPEILDTETTSLGSIAMKELFPGDAISLKDHLEQVSPSLRLTTVLATLVGRYHRLTTEQIDPMSYRKESFFTELLRYRYEALGLPKLNSIVKDLACESQHRGVIHGGLSPKNILVRASSRSDPHERDIAFVDLETACIGSRYFDIGFNLGHLALHGMDKGVEVGGIYSAYVKAYENETDTKLNSQLLKRVTIATMLYRLLHPETKYSLKNIDAQVHKDLYTKYTVLSEEDNDGIRT